MCWVNINLKAIGEEHVILLGELKQLTIPI